MQQNNALHDELATHSSVRYRVRRITLPSLICLAQQRARQQTLDEVRMVLHGHVKAHVVAVQRCIAGAQSAYSSTERDFWLVAGLAQTQRLLHIVERLHSDTSDSLVPHDLEQALCDIATSLSQAYPCCTCHVDVQGHPQNSIDQKTQRALVLVLYNTLHNAYAHANPSFVRIQLQYAPDVVLLVMTNDGRRLPINWRTASGRGLRDSERVVRRLGGTFTIERTTDNETRVTAALPLAHQPPHQKERGQDVFLMPSPFRAFATRRRSIFPHINRRVPQHTGCRTTSQASTRD